MAPHVARLLLLTTTLGGCSLIYSSNRLPDVVDAPVDTPEKPVCDSLKIERVFPTELLEGQGDEGGRSAVLLIQGRNICAGAVVSITPHAGETSSPLIALDAAQLALDDWGLRIAVPVKLKVDANISAGKSVRLDVSVTQPADPTAPGGAKVTSSLEKLEGDGDPPVLMLKGLDELSGAASLPTDTAHVYSHVNVTSISAMDRTGPLIIRSTASIAITGPGPYLFNATATTPGPGGFAGGAGGQALLTPEDGKMGGGAGGGRPNGGGAGFATMGGAGEGGNSPGPVAGEPSITTLEYPNRGSGGAGGQGSNVLGPGGNGGHGGGSIELTAGGNLTVAGTIEANGSDGTRVSNGKAGGGGSGGLVLLRTGGTFSVGGIQAIGGNPGAGGTGGIGSVGRVRVDSPRKIATIPSDPIVGYHGPMLAPTTELVVREPQPRVTFVGEPNAIISYTIEDGEGTTRGPVQLTLSGTGESTIPLGMELFEGYNRLCALVTGVSMRRPEAENCITLAYLFRFP
jgi:hypothetical protein